MFSSQGFFRDTPCPVDNACDLLRCIFFHEQANDTEHSGFVEPRNDSPQRIEQPQSVAPTPPTESEDARQTDVGSSNASAAGEHGATPRKSRKIEQPLKHPRSITTPAVKKTPQTTSAKIPESPTPTLQIKHATEPLNPRMLKIAPSTHQKRSVGLNKLHAAMEQLNERAKKSTDPQIRSIILAPAQLITLALDDEEKTAHEGNKVYHVLMGALILKFQRMPLESWLWYLLDLGLRSELKILRKGTPTIQGERDLATGLPESVERQVLRRLLSRQDVLEKSGYVIAPPSSDEINAADRNANVAKGWEVCCRCKSHFQVFSERRLEDGAFTSGGKCVSHPGKLISKPREFTKYHTCCNEPVNRSVGCTSGPCHVFKTSDPARLALLHQFMSTPDNPEIELDKAISLDCEMGYTTRGLELTRLTLLTWPKGDNVLDVLVRPFGHVIDLNTRHSGITPEQFTEATPYDPSQTAEGPQIVESPGAARGLLFKYINPSTSIVGHGLENDFNALRLIHPCVVDTALLCPHNHGFPNRRPLKSLAQDFLFRTIQNAGIAGHDSAEDAKAAGDVARVLVKRRWHKMVDEGWKVEDDKLKPPKMPPAAHYLVAEKTKEEEGKEQAKKQVEAHHMEAARRMEEENSLKRGYDDMDDDGPMILDYD